MRMHRRAWRCTSWEYGKGGAPSGRRCSYRSPQSVYVSRKTKASAV
jgi:hypothetical protein